jgi:hypothetical protein
MYPGGCGYKSETGGIMRNLRESTTNQKVGAVRKLRCTLDCINKIPVLKKLELTRIQP